MRNPVPEETSVPSLPRPHSVFSHCEVTIRVSTEELLMLSTELAFQKVPDPELPPNETKQEWLPFKQKGL